MNKEVKRELFVIAITFALLIIVSLIPAKGFLRFLLYLVPFVLSALDIFKAVINQIITKRIKNIRNRNLLIVVTALLALIAGRFFDVTVAILLIRLGDIFKDFAVKKATASRGFNPQGSKSGAEISVAILTKYFTPALVILAGVVFLIGFIANISAWREALSRSVICLAIAYPTALTVSVPMAIVSGISRADKNGIAINNAPCIDKLSRCSKVVIDKAGTLADGTLIIKEIVPNSISEEQLLEIACVAEAQSNHPVALAVKKAAKGTMNANILDKVQEIPGLGIVASMSGKILAAGDKKLMEKLGIDFDQTHYTDTVVLHVALGSSYIGRIVFDKTVNDNADKALYRLKSGGVKSIVMLDEDKMSEAARIAEEFPAIDEYHPSLSTENKAKIIKLLVENEERSDALVFVGTGDKKELLGIADADISLGKTGYDCDVVISDGTIEKIPLAISIAEDTTLTAKENIIGALAVKLVILILGIAGAASLSFAVFADVGITALAILNSMRLQFKK